MIGDCFFAFSLFFQSRVPVGSPFGEEVVVVGAFFHEQQVQCRRQSDDEQVKGAKDFRIHRVAVHLVADSEVVVGHVWVEEGEIAQRSAG